MAHIIRFFLFFVLTLWSFHLSVQDEEGELENSLDKRGRVFTLSSVNPDNPRTIRRFRKIMRDAHNELRQSEGSSNMVKLRFDKSLTTMAQTVADTCRFKHTTKDFKAKYVKRWNFVGENIYAGYGVGKREPKNVVNVWYKEKRMYNYEKSSCSGGRHACGHYTQVVWAETKFLGCGVTFCSSLKMPSGKTWKNAYYVVCEYGPGGNKGKRKPYAKGHPCEKCPSDCVDGKMCKKFVAKRQMKNEGDENRKVIRNFLEELQTLMQRDRQVNGETKDKAESGVIKRDDDESGASAVLKRDDKDEGSAGSVVLKRADDEMGSVVLKRTEDEDTTGSIVLKRDEEEEETESLSY